MKPVLYLVGAFVITFFGACFYLACDLVQKNTLDPYDVHFRGIVFRGMQLRDHGEIRVPESVSCRSS